MVNGLSGQKDTGQGRELSRLAVKAAACGRGLSKSYGSFPPLLALSCFVAQDGLELPILLPELPQGRGLLSIPLYLDSLLTVKSKLEKGK